MSEKGRKKKKTSPVFIIIFIACLAVAAYAAYQLVSIALIYKQASDEYDELKQYTHSTGDDGDSDVIFLDSSSDEQSSSAEETKKAPIEVDFDALKEHNPDTIGWIYVGAENISYPIMQSDDNNYYLRRTTELTYNIAGSIFMEYQNSADLTDPHTIIYGHKMYDHSMFGDLSNLYEYEDYKIDDTFWILTPEASYEYKIFCLEQTVADSSVYTLFSGPSEEFKNYIKTQSEASFVDLPIDSYDENSRVVTLSTCTTAANEERFIVQGILVDTIK